MKITKDSLALIDDRYNHPSTSPLIFRFEPGSFPSTELRVHNALVKYASIEGKALYVLDDFFQNEESVEMLHFSKTATFSRNSYGSSEAIEKGEKPALSMNGKERWQFFSRPPLAINEVYKLFGMLAERLGADITTLPWELCDSAGRSSPAVIANRVEEASLQSMELGKHKDCNPENRVSFAVPRLYSQEKQFHACQFVNGAQGNPWLISVMVYTTAEAFLPEYCMGTIFYNEDGSVALRANCMNMRIVLFEGDIVHSIEESKIPSDTSTWRVSYVFKLIVNPKKDDQDLKNSLLELMKTLSPGMEILSPGTGIRI